MSISGQMPRFDGAITLLSASAARFRILYLDFLNRVVDLEILSTGGEAQKPWLVQFACAGCSLVRSAWCWSSCFPRPTACRGTSHAIAV